MKHFRVLADHPKGEIVSSGCDYATATLLVAALRALGATEAVLVHNHGPARRRAEELQASGKWFVIALGSCKACSGKQPATAAMNVPLMQLPAGTRFLPEQAAGPAPEKRRAECGRPASATAGGAPQGMPAWAWRLTMALVATIVAAVFAAVLVSRVPGNVWGWLLGTWPDGRRELPHG
jgi:hypothetical protein